MQEARSQIEISVFCAAASSAFISGCLLLLSTSQHCSCRGPCSGSQRRLFIHSLTLFKAHLTANQTAHGYLTLLTAQITPAFSSGCVTMQEVTQRIYHLFQQSPWWHKYAASQPAAQPYFTALLYRKDTFKPAGSFQSHDFSNSAMGKVLSVELWQSWQVRMCMHTVHIIDIAADDLLTACPLRLLYCWSSLPKNVLYSAVIITR